MIIFYKYFYFVGVDYEIDSDLLVILRKTYVDRIYLQQLKHHSTSTTSSRYVCICKKKWTVLFLKKRAGTLAFNIFKL